MLFNLSTPILIIIVLSVFLPRTQIQGNDHFRVSFSKCSSDLLIPWLYSQKHLLRGLIKKAQTHHDLAPAHFSGLFCFSCLH